MESDRGHRVHVWLSDIFDNNGDVKVPCSNGFVVRSCYKTSVLVYECDGIDGSQVLIVLLRNLSRVNIILEDVHSIQRLNRNRYHLLE
jgi:hypothetical protein